MSRAASIQTVAELAGVSKATVSRVMNGVAGRVSAATRERVLEAVNSLSYRPSRAGSTLRQGRSRLVGLLVPDPGNTYHAAVAQSVERALRAIGMVMILANTGDDPAKQDDMLLEMRALQAVGIVLLGAVKSPGLESSLKAGEPLVFVNRRSPFPTQGPFIGIDNSLAGRIVAKHFVSCGHRNVWIFHSSLTSSAARERVGAFRSKFRALAGPGSLVRDVTVSSRRMESAYERAKELLTPADPPHAVFCTTDEIAYGVAKHCFEMGLRQPQGVMIFGFDGNPLNDYLAPWLSTIQVPYDDFGPSVVATLDVMWNHRDGGTPPDHILPFRTIIATGAHPPAAPLTPTSGH